MPEVDNETLLTVKEVANRLNITTQAIYQRIDKDLAEYCQVVDGKKMLKTGILSVLGKSQIKQEVDEDLTIALQETISILRLQVDTTNLQLVEKDKQIANLNDRLREALELNKNNQVLLLNFQPLIKASEPERPQTQHEEPESVPATDDKPKRKKFPWLF